MKVLILATDIYTRGGIAKYTSSLASALGHLLGPDNVEVLALIGGGLPDEAPTDYRIVVISDHLHTGAKVRYAAKALELGRRRYSLVVCSHLALAPIAAAIRLSFGSPFWVACHGVEAWQHLPFIKRAALKRADCVLPVSRFTAEKLYQVNGIAPEKIRVVYNAIPDSLSTLLLSSNGVNLPSGMAKGNERVLLSVGSLSMEHAYKGFDTVIRALPRILEAVTTLRYIIIGNGDNRHSLEKLAAEMQVAEHVTFAGELGEAELAAHYRACDVFVLPSRTVKRNGYWEGEGFGRVYIEAALAGKPVVGSRGGGAAEAVVHGKTGLLVDPMSVEAVTDAVVMLLKNPKIAARMGDEGRKWGSHNFAQEAMCGAVAELLQPYRSRR